MKVLSYVFCNNFDWSFPLYKLLRPLRVGKCIALPFLRTRHWVVSTTPRPLYSQERPGNHCVGGWVSHQGPVWTGAENLASIGIRSPDRPARSESLYRLSYPGRLISTNNNNIYLTAIGLSPGGSGLTHIQTWKWFAYWPYRPYWPKHVANDCLYNKM
jgi:hypothetical protein